MVTFGTIIWFMNTLNPLSVAISSCGIENLAAALGVTRQAIRKYERTRVTAERVLQISKQTGWRVTPHDLRPDLYPNPTDAVPAEVALQIAAGAWCWVDGRGARSV